MKKIFMTLMLCLVSICIFTSCEKNIKVKNYIIVTESDVKNEILELQNELTTKPDSTITENDKKAIKFLEKLKAKDCISYLKEVYLNDMENGVNYSGKYPDINFLYNEYSFLWGPAEDIVAYQILERDEDWIYDGMYIMAESTFKRRNDNNALNELYNKYGKISQYNSAIRKY